MTFKRVSQILTGQALLRRAILALSIGVLLNMAAWTLAFLFLPEGLLRGKTLAGRLPIGETGGLLRTLAEIFFYNLLIAGGLTAVANLFRVGDLPLGYVYAWGSWVLYGLFLGTDSFSLPRGGKLSPSLLRLAQSSGFYEIAAYTIIAAATVNLFLFRQTSWLNWHTQKVRDWRDVRLNRREVGLAVAALFLLFLANLNEAFSIIESLVLA